MNYFSISAEASNVHKKSVSGTHSEALAVSESRRAHLLLRDKRAQRAIVYYSTGSLVQWVACGNLCLFLSLSRSLVAIPPIRFNIMSVRALGLIFNRIAQPASPIDTLLGADIKRRKTLSFSAFLYQLHKKCKAHGLVSLFYRGIPVFYAWPHSVNSFWSRGLAMKLNYAKPLIISFFLDNLYKDIILPSGWISIKSQAVFKYKLWTQKIAQHSK